MDAKIENGIREEQLESFGRLMAGFAHDMKNHLGIIREANGLMGDILEMGTIEEDPTMVERLQKSIAAIERRVVISAKMMHHLSRIAHRPDTPYASFLINDLLEEEFTFLERFARLRQVDVVFEFAGDCPAIFSNPSLLQHVFYRVYINCLDLLEEKQTLTIVTKAKEKDVAIVFCFSESQGTETGAVTDELLLAAIEKLHGKIHVGKDTHDTIVIELLFSSMNV
jgi:signal transduction histidine kinase